MYSSKMTVCSEDIAMTRFSWVTLLLFFNWLGWTMLFTNGTPPSSSVDSWMDKINVLSIYIYISRVHTSHQSHWIRLENERMLSVGPVLIDRWLIISSAVSTVWKGSAHSNDAYSAVYYWNWRMKKWAYVSSINCGYND